MKNTKKGGEKLRHTYQQKINPDTKTIQDINFLSQTMIRLWNLGVVQAEDWLTEKKAITAYSFNYWLTEVRSVSASFSLLIGEKETCFSEVSSNLSREVLRKLAGSYQSFFELKKNKDNRARKPSIKTLEQFQTLSWSTPKVLENKIFVPKGSGEVLEINIPDYLYEQVKGRTLVHATISRKDGEFFLSIVVTDEKPKTIEEPNFFRAIDLGAGDMAVSDSDGSEFLIPARRPDKYWREEIYAVEERQKQCTKGSNAWEKRAKARRIMYKKAENQRTSYQRKLAKALLEDKVECIVISKPKTRLGLAQSDDGVALQHMGVQNTGYMFRLLTFIKEKAIERGVSVIEISDPHRQGDLNDPNSKFFASRTLLKGVMDKTEITFPTVFVKKNFKFTSSSGVKNK